MAAWCDKGDDGGLPGPAHRDRRDVYRGSICELVMPKDFQVAGSPVVVHVHKGFAWLICTCA